MSAIKRNTFAEVLKLGGNYTDEAGNQIILVDDQFEEGQRVVTIIGSDGYFHSNLGKYPKHKEFLQEYYENQV